jgi:hypothetical protein
MTIARHLMGIAMALSLASPAVAQGAQTGASQPQPTIVETVDAKSGLVVYAVSPRLHRTPPEGRLPITVTSFGGARSLDGRQRVYQARIEITHNYGNKQQYFASVTLGDGSKATVKSDGVDQRCFQAFNCEYTEKVIAYLPEAALRAAVAANRSLRLTVRGNDAFVIVGVPQSYVTALLKKMDGARVSAQ